MMLYPDTMLIDSHCHIASEELRRSAEELAARAAGAGVGRMLIVGCDLEDSREAVRMANEFEDYGAWASVGVHPHEARRYADGLPQSLTDLASDHRVAAIGEAGLDYHYDHSPRDAQMRVFIMQLKWAARTGKPLILHIREAMPDALDVLKDFPGLKPLFHCYSGGLEYLDEVLSMGGLCGIGGAVTWKKSEELREVARRIPLERLLLETDCPYMAPAPHRGKPNEPAWVRCVYEKVAEVRGMEVKELADQIRLNADGFFGWGVGSPRSSRPISESAASEGVPSGHYEAPYYHEDPENPDRQQWGRKAYV